MEALYTNFCNKRKEVFFRNLVIVRNYFIDIYSKYCQNLLYSYFISSASLKDLNGKKENNMNKSKQAKRIFIFMVLSLITTFVLLVHTDSVRAEEVGDINPDSGFNYFLLLEGQSVTVTTTQTTPFDFTTIGATSIGNITVSASLSITGNEATGFWWVSIIGTGGKFWYDFTFGIAPVLGSTAIVDIDTGLSFVLATGGVALTSPVSVEEPVTYSITLRGSN